MIYSKHSSRSLAELEMRLREAAAKSKFGVLHVLDLQQTLRSKGIDLGRECKVFDVCDPQAASTALNSEMKVSAVLPCRISIFSDPEGCTIATIRPTDLFRATGLTGAESLATEIETRVLAIIDDAA
jgi:uncharacterized protein (DUF302 family)